MSPRFVQSSNRVSDQGKRFDGRMIFETTFFTLTGKRVGAWVFPDVGARSAMAAQLDVIDVRRTAILEREDKFMTRSVERAHALRWFLTTRKDSEGGRLTTRLKALKFPQMSPVHANQHMGAADWHRAFRDVRIRLRKSVNSACHFTRSGRKFAMSLRAFARHVAGNFHVERGSVKMAEAFWPFIRAAYDAVSRASAHRRRCCSSDHRSPKVVTALPARGSN